MDEQNLDIYGNPPIPWTRAREQLEASAREDGAGRTYWLATTGGDRRPHLTAVGALWIEDRLYFVSGPRTRKSRNLAANPTCAMSVSLDGIDLVVEGTAARVADPESLERIANLYAARGWPARASEGAITAPYSAPSAGPGPWDLYAITPSAAVGVATREPHGATRWRFG
jgi:hypothetical protein